MSLKAELERKYGIIFNDNSIDKDHIIMYNYSKEWEEKLRAINTIEVYLNKYEVQQILKLINILKKAYLVFTQHYCIVMSYSKDNIFIIESYNSKLLENDILAINELIGPALRAFIKDASRYEHIRIIFTILERGKGPVLVIVNNHERMAIAPLWENVLYDIRAKLSNILKYY